MNIIEINHVSMKFRMANDKIQSLKEYVVATLTKKLTYKELCVFEDLNFSVEKGEVVGIIGRNGAGKSTLLKIISGVLAPTEGKVTCYGNIVPMLELGSGFDYDLSGSENIFLNGSILGYSEDFLNDRYQEIVDFSELGEFINEPIRNYSSGMLMRLAFSIATMVQPEILIVDEVLAVGDEAFQKKSKKKMLELMSGGTTVLFVSHSVGLIKEICSKVLWIEKGKIRGFGNPKEICDAYEKSLNPDSILYDADKSRLRNTDSYKFVMDVLLVYHEDEMSYYSALVRKEQLLVGNISAHGLCIRDMKTELVAQNRMILFINCSVEEAGSYINDIKSMNKAYVIECDSQWQVESWRKAYPQSILISNNPDITEKVIHTSVALTERLLQVAEWLRYDRKELPLKSTEDIDDENEMINYNRAIWEKKKHKEEGIRIALVTDDNSQYKADDIAKAMERSCTYKIRKVLISTPEDVMREIEKTDYVFNILDDTVQSWNLYIPCLCKLADVSYCGRIMAVEDVEKALDLIANGNQDENFRNIEIGKYITLETGLSFSRQMKEFFSRCTAFVIRDPADLEQYPAIIRKIKESMNKGYNTVILSNVVQDNAYDCGGLRVPVVNKATKYIFGSFDTVVIVDPDEFPFIISYPNIQERIYFVAEWSPNQYDYGDFRRVQGSQSYLPCVPVTFWTDSENVRQWLKEKYDKEAILIR